jgi:alpha-L-rhamnosidase
MWLLWLSALVLQAAAADLAPAPAGGRSPIAEPYPYIARGSFSGPAVPESPDPLVAYRWPDPKASDGLEIFLLRPKAVSADRPASFENLASLAGGRPDVTVTGPGSIRLDFGVEAAAWLEFDSPDCPGGVEMSLSEYNEPGHEKTLAPVRHGRTYRLELNRELYEGVRFGWIQVRSFRRPWHITGIRAVCQVKPANYNGGFACDDPLLTRIWYTCAYSVRASLCKGYFGAILMDRGDRMSWTGDAHPAQAAALAAFGNADFIKRNIEATSSQDNGIRSYSLYWVLSLVDYFMYTGDSATLGGYVGNACAKLEEAYAAFGRDPKLRFYGWDERLCAGFELWFKPCPEAQRAYELLSIRAWREFAAAMGRLGRDDLRQKYDGYALEKMTWLRKDRSWLSGLGLHAAADAVTTGLLSRAEEGALFEREFSDRTNRVSLSPFNQYFIIQAMARMNKRDDALGSVRDLWGGMVKYGGTTTFEVFRPSWNEGIGPNDAVPNTQCGITSLCHPWGAGPVKWLNEEILGIVPTSPGFETYDVLPHLGRTLTRVSGRTPTPSGEIRASFDVSSGRCLLSAPPGTVGRLGIPKAEMTITGIRVNGALAWDGAFHSVPGLEGDGQDAEFVYFRSVEPGTYEVSVSYSGATPAYEEPRVRYAARFIRQDAGTAGSWGGVYGKDGYVLCNYEGRGVDRASLPPYVTSLEYFRAFPKNGAPDPTTWASPTTDRRALSPDPSNPPSRTAACVSNTDQTMTVTIGIAGPREYQVALYFVDWRDQGARQAVEMFDAGTLKLVAPVKIVDRFPGGRYIVYAYDRSAKFRIERIRGDGVTLSGIFFDPAPAAGMEGGPAPVGHGNNADGPPSARRSKR